jgi:tRNA(Ile)-lysidine synthase
MEELDQIYKHPRLKTLCRHVGEFMDDKDLWPKSKEAVVAVSGGADSILLLMVLAKFLEEGKLKSLKAVHINHGSREENYAEEDLVAEFCYRIGVSLKIEILDLSHYKSNFEFIARKERYAKFKSHLKKGDSLFLGHHIDDSIEWSLLMQAKSGDLQPSLGIPVINGPYVRPFMCLARKQIEGLCKDMNLAYINDPTNLELRFERNFIRHEILPKIKERFPGFIRHYVSRQNNLAYKLRKARLGKRKIVDFKVKADNFGGRVLFRDDYKNDFKGAKQDIIKIVKELSDAPRGVLQSQADKMIRAQFRGKQGPFIFSGGVYGYMGQGTLYFISRDKVNLYKEIDRVLLHSLRKASTAQIPNVSTRNLGERMNKDPFPYLIFSRIKEGQEKLLGLPPGRKRPHPLLPQSTAFALRNKLYIGELPRLLANDASKRLKHELPLIKIDSWPTAVSTKD